MFYSIAKITAKFMFSIFLPVRHTVSVHVGDWVEVQCDYSPGVCSEGGTGVVIAKAEGGISFTFILTCI